MQYMIETFVLSGSLQRQDIQWLFDHTYNTMVSLIAGADGAGIGISDVLT
jgi:hypothetical protein